MELGKVPSSTENGKGRKKPKEGEGDRSGRDKKRRGKRKKKKTGQKRRRRRVQRRPEKGSISSFRSRSAILDPSSLRRKGREDELGPALERGSFNTVFQRERHNFPLQQTNRAVLKRPEKGST